MKRFILITAAAACLAGVSGPAWAAGIQLNAEVQGRLGIKTQSLALTHQSGEIDAFAKVLDPGPLVQLASDLATAEAAAAASRAEAQRATALHASNSGVAAKDMEAAVSQARQDALKVDFLRQRLGLEWGPGVARLSPAARAKLMRGLAAGTVALVHVDTHNNEGQTGARFVKVDVGSDSVRGVVIGPARAAEPRLQSSGLIVQIEGPSAILLSVGLTQSAHIETSDPKAGVLLPRSAIIRFQGADWAYVQTSATAFTRRLVQNPAPEADGFFVADGFAAGDKVVVGGAAALFADELNASTGAR